MENNDPRMHEPMTPQSMIDEWTKKQWLHDHQQFRFRTPMGEEYIDRAARRPHDKVLEDLTPKYTKSAKTREQILLEEDGYIRID